MINAIINGSLKHRFMVLLATAVLAVAGLWSFKHIPLDAIPDLSDVQVIIYTEYPGQTPQVIEDQVTYPLTTAMLAVPHAKVVRGYSFFGSSFVYIIFEDGVDPYWARSRVLEYLNFASQRLPQGISPSLGPDATGVGWIYEYALIDKTGKHDLAQLRSIQDWYLRYPLQAVSGVSEVASVGGYVKQYQIEVNPNALLAYGIPLSKVKQAIQRSNNDVGGRLIEMAETEYMVRGLGYIRSLEDIQSIPVGFDSNGTPVRLQDVAHIQIGPELRRGVVELDGEGEVVGGIVIMRFGENAQKTILRIHKKLQELQQGLPEGVEIVTVYDRGHLIERAVNTLNNTLIQELAIVSVLVALFLLHLRSSLVIIITLPLGILIAFIIMKWQGINANIMSLGGIAIAIGDMVDGAIVMVEHAHKHLSDAVAKKKAALTQKERWQVIGNASREVAPALFFSLLIITVSFVPIFVMQAQEGRLFSPLAYTKSYAMAAAAILTITVVPVLMGYLIRGRIIPERENPANQLLHFIHAPILKLAMRWRVITFILATLLLTTTIYPLSKIGSEFMPPLDEGDILYMPSTFPGISITKAKELLQQTDKIIKSFPEVQHVFGKIGRAETATDTAPLSMMETTIQLKPRSEWPDPDKTTQTLMAEMDQTIQFPGLANVWTMPIKTRIDMLSTGIKTPIGIKISGPDLNTLQHLSEQIEQIMQTMPETLSAFGDRAVGGYYLDFNIKREEAARYGLTVGDIQDVIQSAIGGVNITETIEGLERYPVNLRYPRELRDNRESLERMLIPTPTGAQIPLTLVADVTLRRGPDAIKSENARPNAWVYVDIKNADIGGFVSQAKQLIARQIALPTGYTIGWSGQFEYMERAAERLRIAIPLTLTLIFFLLYVIFRNITEPVIVMLTIPFGLIGGIWLVYILEFNLSVAVYVGFIALAGTAAETGVMVLSFINIEIARLRRQKQTRLSPVEINEAVKKATSMRMRPVAITAFTTMIALIPVMFATGSGADVTQRIAAPVLGGMLTVLILSLLVIPALYSLILQIQEETMHHEHRL
ncbi:Cu(I)/Ag(I) efflux system membrane protein CusA/SilA [Nitrosomonas cryotolerans]|uniref:Cu(I)/Ag(I) efflux system membrane protein CusA/SilA n=1 Tax=Nitrosomonas cryotolerans ATCC 49181 TaxID=1131553 RepID=A0A1N6HE99_9PROT|nr:CusA/CzcA family heavy metal efflux RND transporter [Nitrosomonas cryotolerans]SFP73270.1 Cu(I)/Ag(I) efflux system membrane protein CusA/SilA [Nitrosomonas cryotolerans]SIO18076.1 Cu(I)/Ag(I) efflux system membrane protein CusA/SilA [Nitrosomonas cryotolerans ATCC 49181]